MCSAIYSLLPEAEARRLDPRWPGCSHFGRNSCCTLAQERSLGCARLGQWGASFSAGLGTASVRVAFQPSASMDILG